MNEPKQAWLITWEGTESDVPRRCKIAAILSFRLNRGRIGAYLPIVFESHHPELLGMLLERRKKRLNYLREVSVHINPAWEYGTFREYLFARQVRDLQCEERDGMNVWSWTELPKYEFPPCDEPGTGPLKDSLKMIRPEMPETYTWYKGDHAPT